MRSVSVVVCLTAVFSMSAAPTGFAASASSKANASYQSGASAQSARADEVPSNCIRQSCGKLWCWQMKGH